MALPPLRASPVANRLWHTDASFVDPPGRYSMLSARVVPAVRADTEFAEMRAAYDALDAETRASIEGLRVYHSIVYSRHVLGFDFSEDEHDKLKGAVHPLVRTIRAPAAAPSISPRTPPMSSSTGRCRRAPARADRPCRAAAVPLSPHQAAV